MWAGGRLNNGQNCALLMDKPNFDPVSTFPLSVSCSVQEIHCLMYFYVITWRYPTPWYLVFTFIFVFFTTGLTMTYTRGHNW